MKGLTRRIAVLEATASGNRGNLNHLTDEELEQYVFDVIQQFADAGVALPDDWRQQYDHSCIRFLEWIEREAKRMISCEP